MSPRPGRPKCTITLLSLILGLGSFSIAKADSNSDRLQEIRSYVEGVLTDLRK